MGSKNHQADFLQNLCIVFQMRHFLHEQLRNALLSEMAGGHYRDGERFLSNRKICRQWKVSETTAKLSLGWLVREGFLEARPRSGYRLQVGHQARALLVLHQSSSEALRPSPGWRAGVRAQLEPEAHQAKRRHRIALIADGNSAFWQNRFPIGKIPPDFPKSSAMQAARGFFESAMAGEDEIDFFIYDATRQQEALIQSALKSRPPQAVVYFRRRAFKGPHPMLDYCCRSRMKLLVVFEDANRRDVPILTVNNVALGFEAARCLIETGHRRIGVLVGSTQHRAALQRWRGAMLAVEKLGKGKVALRKIVYSHQAAMPLPKRVKDLFQYSKTRPDGLVVTNLQLFDKLQYLLKELRLRPGRNLSVINSGEPTGTELFPFAFDCMKIDFRRVGATAHSMAVELVEDRLRERTRLLEPTYVAGESLCSTAPVTPRKRAGGGRGAAAKGGKDPRQAVRRRKARESHGR